MFYKMKKLLNSRNKESHIERKKGGILQKWFSSYLLIIGIFLVIMVVSIIISNSIINREMSKQKQNIILSAKDNIDSVFGSAEKVMIQVANESDILNYLHPYGMENNEIILQAKLASDKLNNLLLGNDFISQTFIYSKYNNRIITPMGMRNSESVYESYQGFFTYEKWKSILNGTYNNNYIYFTEKENGKECVRYIVNATTIPMKNDDDFAGNLFILIDMSKFVPQIEKNKINNNMELMMTDADGRTLYFTDGMAYVKNSDSPARDTSYISQRYGTNFTYTLIEKKSIIRNVMTIQVVIIFIFAIIAVGICSLLAYRIALKNYMPLKRIMQYLNITDFDGDELKNMENLAKKLVNVNSQLEEKLDKQKKGSHSSILTKIIKGNFTDYDDMMNNLKWYDVEFVYPYFCVIGFYLDSSEDVMNELVSNYKDDVYSISLFVLNNVYGELISEHFPINFVEVDNILVGIINMPDKTENNFDILEQIYNRAEEVLTKEFNLSYFVSVSDIGENITCVPMLYKSMQENFENIFISKDKKLYMHRDNLNCRSNDDNNYIIQVQKIYSLVRNLKLEEAMDSIDNLAETYLNSSHDPYISKIRACILSCNILEGLNGVLDEELFKEIKSDIDIINKYITPERYLHNLRKSFKKIEGTLDKHCFDGENMVAKVNHIIEENYDNRDLSVSFISEKLNMSVSSLSNEYKKLSGCTVLKYIHSTRIAKAKGLLIDTKLMIKDIAEAVGYDHTITFIRIFKKYEGITPTEFRETFTDKKGI